MSGLVYEPGYAKAIAPFANAPRPVSTTALELRATTDVFLSSVMPKIPAGDKIQQATFTVRSYDGAEIELRRYATREHLAAPEPQPAVLAVHGGGFIAGNVDICGGACANAALDGDRPVFAVAYRLAPEHPAPAGVEDAFAAFKYLVEHAAELNIDPARIGIKGESAGAGVGAAVALMARDRAFSPPPAKLILIYPMLDDRTEYPADAAFLKLASWTPEKNKLAWDAYVGEDRAEVSPYAAPARAESLRGLPPTYIDIGTLDLFRDEALEFAQRLMREDVEVEFHLLPGVPHAFDIVAVGSKWQVRATEARAVAMKSF
ncbi:Alpha/Beta hydrolase protein [Dactylonectria estremocensis]|uniref:Alpha/Beta hydrolase protein n=1 Tax=Dactylonectria estremocensis TaxID=1079267 RepID=A0A9P9FKL4_9HYPO|nr:Alpha/Beta hydrolase protein [Dactylonectria estremocensis]